MKFKILGAFLLAFSLSALSSNIGTTTTITGIYTYGIDTGSFHNLISVKVANPIVGCEDGFWVQAADNEGNKNISAFLLSAFHTGSNVYFAAYTDQLWNGKHCKIHSAGLTK